MRNIGDTELAIADRFFFAIEELTRRNVIRGLKTFTSKHNINYGNINSAKNHPEEHSIKTEFLAWLAQDYGVSCTWLLLGNGEMFTEDPATYADPAPKSR